MTAVLEQRTARAGWLLVATTASGAVNYAYAVVLTHGLTPAQYASFAAGQALIVVAAVVCAAGLPWAVAREIAQHDRADVVSFALVAGLGVGAALALPLAALELAIGTAGDAAVVAISCLILATGSTVLGYFQGRGRMATIALLLTAETVVKAGIGLALAFGTSLGATGALLGFACGGLVLLSPLPALRHLLRRPAWQPDLLRAAVQQTRLQVTVAVVGAGDTVLVGLLGLAGGPYQAASALCRVPLFAANALATATFPQLARDGAASGRAAALRSYLLVGILAAGGLGTLPDEIRGLLFPSSFDDVDRWLPCTAVLGLALGALNLGVMFLQAGDPRGRTAGGLAAIAAGYLGTMAAAGSAFAVGGLAAGAAVGGLLTVGAITAFPAVRDGALLLVRSRRARRELAGVLLAVCALAMTTDLLLWLAVAAVAGYAVLRVAFPELWPGGRR